MKNKFGARLKELIKDNNMTQKELAKLLNVSESCVSYWIQGITQPTANYIIDIADYFNICTDYLLGRKDYY